MYELQLARRTVAAVAGFGFGFLIFLASSAARESGASPFDTGVAPFRALEFQLASLAPIEIPLPNRIVPRSEPFNVETSAPVKGAVQYKWAGVKKALPREARLLAKCRDTPADCAPAAKRFLAVIDKAAAREGWTRIAEVNRAINLSIRPVSDMAQYGVHDRWASPLMTFASGAGDCEDYAIAKYVALRELGFVERDLRLVIVHDHAANEDHAVTAVRHENRWLILDNKSLAIRQDMNIAAFDPLFVIDSGGVKSAKLKRIELQDPWADASISRTLIDEPPAGLFL